MDLHVHLVFTTRYRRGALADPILTRCEQIMADVYRDFGAQLGEFTGDTDHVHLLVHYPPAVAVSKLVNSLKGVSARYLRQEFHPHLRRYLWDGHLWSPSYFAGSCGGTTHRGQGVHRKPETSRLKPQGRDSSLTNC